MRRTAERAEAIQRRFDWPLLIAALLVLPAIALQDPTLSEAANTVGDVLDYAIWAAFALELVVMVSVSPDPRRWLKENWTSPVIVFLTPPFLPAAFAGVRLLRLLRLIRLVRVVPIARRLFSLDGLRYGAIITFVTIVLGGLAFAVVEPRTNTVDGLWWAVTTVTTVGYGDIVPTTDSARIIAIMVLGVGIGFVALITGVAAERFLHLSEEEEQEDIERRQMHDEIRALRAEVAALRELLERDGGGPPRAPPATGA